MSIRILLKERIADKEYAERRVVSLKEISEATGIHRVTISKLANHKKYNVGIDTFDQLCRYFSCPIGELVEYVPDDEQTEGQD